MGRRRAGRRWLAVGLGAILALSVSPGPARAGQGPSGDLAGVHATHVRALDARAQNALRAGLEGSPTFRQLVEALEAGGVVVYVETTQRLTAYGQTTLMGATRCQRFLRVSLDIRNLGPWMTACLAHELQHAIEISAAPGVRDQDAVEGLYRRIGEVGRGGGWCTVAARRAGTAVLNELRVRAAASH